jgi:hypothetical protein
VKLFSSAQLALLLIALVRFNRKLLDSKTFILFFFFFVSNFCPKGRGTFLLFAEENLKNGWYIHVNIGVCIFSKLKLLFSNV